MPKAKTSALHGALWAVPAILGLLACLALFPGKGLARSADFLPPDPAANIVYTIPGSCSSAPTGAACEGSAVTQLQAARSEEPNGAGGTGVAAYQLPSDFLSLPGTEQILILANEDRVAYGEQPILGLNASIDAAALAGADADEDPAYPSDLPPGWSAYSNNTINLPNALFAYYFWMYADGYTGVPNFGNIDCLTPTDAGCWGHRHDIFEFPDFTGNALGVAGGTDSQGRPVFGLELVEAQTPLPYVYTWQQAVADGAGPAGPPVTTSPTTTSPPATTTAPGGGGGGGNPPPTTTATTSPATTTATLPMTTATVPVTTTRAPVVRPKRYLLTRNVRGDGSIKVRPASGDHRYKPGTLVKLTAQPESRSGWIFSHWRGPCASRRLQCTLRMNRAEAVTAVFTRKKK